MEVFIVKAYWRYEAHPVIVGVCDKEHIDQIKADYMAKYDVIKDSFRSFEVEEFTLNVAEG